MLIPGFDEDFERLDTPLPIYKANVSAEAWVTISLRVRETHGQIVSLWGSDRPGAASSTVHAAYRVDEGLLWVELSVGRDEGYPDLSEDFSAAIRMQRALFDMTGLRALDAADTRPWLRHDAWPADFFPLRAGQHPAAPSNPGQDDYAFVRVEGDGVHEIPVGPVHAGIIEPGHFRFSVVGEKVLRLEERLGYTHKGVEHRFVGMDVATGARLAGRVSGDSTVAYAWAYAMAVESAAGMRIPERARWLRAVLLERERIANHLGDLGALGNDAAFGFALSQFSCLREDWQRLNHTVFGHRLLMDVIQPGGVACRLLPEATRLLLRQMDEVEDAVRDLRRIFEEHAGLQDRFVTTGRVSEGLASQLGLVGFAARASGIARDLRSDFPWPPYDQVDFKVVTQPNGDVAARVNQRFDEILESLRIQRLMLGSSLPLLGLDRVTVGAPRNGEGLGWIEGWRGEVLVSVAFDAEGHIARCHCHDPSWQNWPVLEHAVIGNIVADFPLINKSFNLSYAGQDL